MNDQDMDDDRDNTPPFFHHKTNNKVLFTAIVSLSFVVILVTLLHIYVRCVHRRQARRRAALRQLRLYTTTAHEPSKTGLDPTVIASLPMFIFKPNDEAPTTECAVCISILEDGEMVRILPNCKHNFHAECIDNWLSANSTCPICRTEAEPQLVVDPSELAGGVPPTAPPLESVTSNEGTSEGAAAKVIGSSSSSRLSSFRKMLTRERSSQRIQSRAQEDGLEDLERQ